MTGLIVFIFIFTVLLYGNDAHVSGFINIRGILLNVIFKKN